jgi:hypothetical protein
VKSFDSEDNAAFLYRCKHESEIELLITHGKSCKLHLDMNYKLARDDFQSRNFVAKQDRKKVYWKSKENVNVLEGKMIVRKGTH